MSRKLKCTAVIALMATLPLAAQQETSSAGDSLFSNAVFDIMLSIVVLLLLVIIAMAEMVKAGAARQRDIAKKEKKNSNIPAAGLLLLFFFASVTLHAQDAAATTALAPAPVFNYWGMGEGIFYLMLTIIFSEMLIAVMLFRSGMLLIRPDVIKTKKIKEEPSFLEKINQSVAVEQESAIMMDHDYDGIRELDNNLPPWWKYGFYLTIVVSVVYLFHFHVLHTGKLSLEEYSQEMKNGADAIAEYQKSAVDLVDENTVKLLTDAGSLSEGQAIFKQNCVACHGEFGEGKEGLGPNFADDYWLHGGSAHDVFRSVKYGWTDKGMKSWQQDLKPSEIQLVVSFIKSLRGTNPPNAKEKQGELYIEEGEKPTSDSVKAAPDSLQANKDSIK
jgi:cytochrome c oxidase cbb3-type subunit 3